ncbi:MAG: adenylate/guanylate cyclase domain-containing protein [Candidatus Liptonbacteria bacterium]
MKRYSALLPGMGAACIALGIFWLGLFSGPEHFLEDILFSPKAPSDNVIIVAIDNDSLQKIGQWPWRRGVYADLISKLNNLSTPPKAIGIDVVFSEPSRYGEDDDQKLADALQTSKVPVVMPIEADPLEMSASGIPQAGKFIEPRTLFNVQNPEISKAHVNLITDPDGVVRYVPLNIKDVRTGNTVPSFSEVISGIKDDHYIKRIAYLGPPKTISRVSFADALTNTGTQAQFSGKYVLIGATVSDLHDEQLTPVSNGVPMSGVEIQAQVVEMLRSGRELMQMPKTRVGLWVFLAALLPSILFLLIKRLRYAFLATIIIGLIYIPAVIILFERGIVGNILHVNLAWILGLAAAFAYRYFVMERDRRSMRNVFSKYVSKDVLEEILSDVSKVKLGGEEKEATVFFSDVRGFTTLSEKLTPIQLTHFLNRYLTRMTDIALERRGVVDKYIGDAIMVFWGAPLSNPNHVLDAMEASLVMIDELHKFNKESAERGDPPIDIGIGFNSGRVVAGNMGSEQRFDYTVMGDTVNLASRLEGQTKTYIVHIITSEYTMALVSPEELVRRGIVWREIDRIRVKGKKLPVTIFEIVENGKIEIVKKIKDKFASTLAAYYKGDWDACIAAAEKILEQADDGPTKVLLERARHFKEEPPENWEGVYEFKTK